METSVRVRDWRESFEKWGSSITLKPYQLFWILFKDSGLLKVNWILEIDESKVD